jgi:NTP pyrophosphatase (non-canonical NTP hydrolase)|tara:strand:+ start:81 stop:332 length:252 start_codon:yes stop_codon:yes gene_type:complete
MKKQEEMFVITMEECGELIQACSKMLRTKGNNAKYLKNLQDEVGDVCTMIEVLKISGLVTQEMIDTRIKQKTLKLEEWSNIFK